MKPEELLDLTIYQYNAYCEGYKLKQADELVSLIESAYYNAYWNGTQKHKKSLSSVVRNIYKEVSKSKIKRTPIDFNKVDKEFAEMEELRKYGSKK